MLNASYRLWAVNMLIKKLYICNDTKIFVMKHLLALFLCMYSVVAVVQAQNGTGRFKGNWNGEISVGAQKIMMEFEIMDKEGVVLGKMSAQGVKDIPVAVEINGDSLHLQVKQLGMRINGVLQGNEVKGTFFQNGFTTSLVLKQGKVELKRPQTPKEPFPYKTEEVTFENSAEGAVLSGTLTFPIDYESMKPHKVPVVVMVTGSGTQNRDEEVFGHKPFAVIADWLARNGIASLRYDDRGAGKSTGEVRNATSRNNANDARCGVKFVRSLKKFGKVGMLGHSEGGTIALMLAGEQVPDFVVSMAGVATSGMECIIWQNLAQMELQGVPEQMRKDYGKALEGIYTERIRLYRENTADSTKFRGGAIPQAQQFVQDMCKKEGISLPMNFLLNLVKVASMESPWLDWFVGYSPEEAVGKIKCPVMAINGDLDMQVPAQSNLDLLHNLLPHKMDNLIREYPGKNHLFQNCTRANSLQYKEIEETISYDVLEDISEWINSLK